MKVLPISFNYNKNLQFRSNKTQSTSCSIDDLKAIDSGKYGADYKHIEFINKKRLLLAFNKIHFGYQDYQNLSPLEKQIINILNEMGSDTTNCFGTKNLSIKKDAERILRMAIKTKEKLDKEYSNGYKLVGVGNSPAALVETMHDFLGADALTLPFSKQIFIDFDFPFEYKSMEASKGYEKFDAKDWEKYLKFFGIYKNFTKEIGKKLIFTDFVSDGNTKYCIESLLKGMGFDESTEFIEIFDLMPCKSKENSVFLPDDSIDLYRFIESGGLKRYAKKPGIAYYFHYENIVKNPQYYVSQPKPETFKFKLFRCALYDIISKSKKL